MDKSSLLTKIRGFKKEFNERLDALMDMVITMEDLEPQSKNSHEEVANDGWLTVRQVCEYLNISQTTFYEGIRSGVFPKGFAFGPKTIRWRISDIIVWQKSKCSAVNEVPRKRRGRPSRVMKIGALIHV